MAAMDVQVRIRAIDYYSKEFARLRQQMTGLERVSGAISRAGSGVLGAGARAIAPAALAYGAQQALVSYAAVERQVNRIGITAGATADETKAAFAAIDTAAVQYATTQADVLEGLDTLVAAGRSLPDAMSFLPAVTATAQAAGAANRDIAATADAVGRNFGITGDRMQGAFDILVAGGKAGMFELKDMAAYLPSLAPSFAALGYSGEEGLKRLVTMLQVTRSAAGTSSEAATNLSNIFAKIESEETSNKFSKMGVDLRKEMAKARAEGRDLIDFFVELTEQTVNGDLSKLPLLFGDMQMLAGIRALINGGEQAKQVMAELGNAAGSTRKDLDQVLGDSQAKIDRMSASWSKFVKLLGAGIANGANPVLDEINERMEAGDAYARGLAKEEARGASKDEVREEYDRRYGEANPDFTWYNPNDRRARSNAFVQDMEAYGRGDAASPYTNVDRIVEARRTQRFPSQADGEAASRALLARGGGGPSIVPVAPETRILSDAEQRAEYGRGRVLAEQRMQRMSPPDPVAAESSARIEVVQERIAAAAAGQASPPQPQAWAPPPSGLAMPSTEEMDRFVAAAQRVKDLTPPMPSAAVLEQMRTSYEAARASLVAPLPSPAIDTTVANTNLDTLNMAADQARAPITATADVEIGPALSKLQQLRAAAVEAANAINRSLMTSGGAGGGSNFNARVRDQF